METTIVVAIIGAAGLIIAAMIQTRAKRPDEGASKETVQPPQSVVSQKNEIGHVQGNVNITKNGNIVIS